MEFRARHRYAPMSARKARPVVDLVRGMSVNQALETLYYIPRRAAPMLTKLIKSAVANAGQEGGVEAGELVIKRLVVDGGPLKQGRLRWRPGPRGRASPIRKRSCHFEVVLETVAKIKSSKRSKGSPKPSDRSPEAKKDDPGAAAGGKE